MIFRQEDELRSGNWKIEFPRQHILFCNNSRLPDDLPSKVPNNSGLAIRVKRSIIALLLNCRGNEPIVREFVKVTAQGRLKEDPWHIPIGAEFCWEVC